MGRRCSSVETYESSVGRLFIMGRYRGDLGKFQGTLRIRNQVSDMGSARERTAKWTLEQRLSAALSKTVYWLRTRRICGLFRL
jgi:hypothetical protein